MTGKNFVNRRTQSDKATANADLVYLKRVHAVVGLGLAPTF